MSNVKGFVHLYEGDGKGKTTAAVGLCLRAVGAGLRVGWVSFLKDGSSAEMNVLRTLDSVKVYPCLSKLPFTWVMTDAEKQQAVSFYDSLFSTIEQDITALDMLILDEAVDAVNTGLLDEAQLLSLIDRRPERIELVLTGHTPSPALTKRAEYHTVMSARSHPYENGITARRGIDY